MFLRLMFRTQSCYIVHQQCMYDLSLRFLCFNVLHQNLRELFPVLSRLCCEYCLQVGVQLD